MADMFWFLALGIAGGACVITGVHILAGTGWAFVAGGVLGIAAAALIRRGMNA